MPAFLLSPLFLKITVTVIAAIALAWLWHLFVERYREQGRAEVRVEWEADKARRIKATTDMTLLWDSKRIEAEKAAQERDDERAKRATEARERLKALPPAVAAVVVPAPAVGLLNRTIDDTAKAAGTTKPPDAASSPAAASADSTVGLLTGWGVTVVGMYEACRDRLNDWARFYESLRAAQLREVAP